MQRRISEFGFTFHTPPTPEGFKKSPWVPPGAPNSERPWGGIGPDLGPPPGAILLDLVWLCPDRSQRSRSLAPVASPAASGGNSGFPAGLPGALLDPGRSAEVSLGARVAPRIGGFRSQRPHPMSRRERGWIEWEASDRRPTWDERGRGVAATSFARGAESRIPRSCALPQKHGRRVGEPTGGRCHALRRPRPAKGTARSTGGG